MPNSNDKGLTVNMQLNYLLGDSVYLYFNSGISSWDKNIILVNEDTKELIKFDIDPDSRKRESNNILVQV